MSSNEEDISPLEAAVAEHMPTAGPPTQATAEISPNAQAVTEQTQCKSTLEDSVKAQTWDHSQFENLCRRRYIYAPAFEAYGGVAGFYDYGPVGCAIKANWIAAWRAHFVLEDDMLEVDTPAMTPEDVLKASGHVDRFTDVMVKDVKNGDCIRADHLLEDVMEARINNTKLSQEDRDDAKRHYAQAGNYTKEELQELFFKYEIKSPSGNELSEPKDFNMMFASEIGPSGRSKGFLRPETSQGIFLAFKRLYEYNNSKLPFAGAQIGVAYRNEIAPKNGMLRVREFQMAEIEHFMDPADQSCAKFAKVADVELPLLSAEDQIEGRPTKTRRLGDAVADGTIASETLGYFIGRIMQFLVKIGCDVTKMRFRQHMANEMAHYACACWDAELLTSFGWVECVGCSDRSVFDLSQHTIATTTSFKASVTLPLPIVKDVLVVNPNKRNIGSDFRSDTEAVLEYLANIAEEQAQAIEAAFGHDGKGYFTFTVGEQELTLEPRHVTSVERKTIKIHERKFTPSVIEPSFGIGRCIFCLLEHVYAVRENDNRRGFLRLPPIMAPVKCSLLPLSNSADLAPIVAHLKTELIFLGVIAKVDDSGIPIGRRYARTDEIGIPFGITVDFMSAEDKSATIRERDTTKQIRLPIDDIPLLILRLSTGRLGWVDAVEKYGLIVQL